VIHFLKFIFHVSTLLLIILSLFPGSLIGFFLYGDFGVQPDIVPGNPFGTTINHFFAYFYVSFLGFCAYLKAKEDEFRKLLLVLIFLSVMLEVLQSIIPNRSFQVGDLAFNILGVLVAYFIIKIYLFIIKR